MDSWPIKFSAGAKPTVSTKRKSPTDTAEVTKEKQPKTDKDRSFSHSWLSEYSWLEYSDETKLMKCRPCVEYVEGVAKKNPKCADNIRNKFLLVTGSKNYRKSSLNQHGNTNTHKEAMNRKHAIEKPTETPAAHGLLALQEHTRKQIELKFRNIHAVVKHNRSLSDYKWLCDLDKAKGLDTGTSYNNRFASVNFFNSIAAVERTNLNETMNSANISSLTTTTLSMNRAMKSTINSCLDLQKNFKIQTLAKTNFYVN